MAGRIVWMEGLLERGWGEWMAWFGRGLEVEVSLVFWFWGEVGWFEMGWCWGRGGDWR